MAPVTQATDAGAIEKLVVDAALAIASKAGWEQLRLHAIADRTGRPLAEIGRRFRDITVEPGLGPERHQREQAEQHRRGGAMANSDHCRWVSTPRCRRTSANVTSTGQRRTNQRSMSSGSASGSVQRKACGSNSPAMSRTRSHRRQRHRSVRVPSMLDSLEVKVPPPSLIATEGLAKHQGVTARWGLRIGPRRGSTGAKPRPDEQEPDKRLPRPGERADDREVHGYQGPWTVDPAEGCGEGGRAYLGRSAPCPGCGAATITLTCRLPVNAKVLQTAGHDNNEPR